MYHLRIEGYWNHVTRIKVIVNPILRKIQFFTNRPYVIASNTEFNEHKKPKFLGYIFCRVRYYTEQEWNKKYAKES
jgi:hypothetical protein